MIISQKDDAKIVRIVRQAKLCRSYVYFGFLVVSSTKTQSNSPSSCLRVFVFDSIRSHNSLKRRTVCVKTAPPRSQMLHGSAEIMVFVVILREHEFRQVNRKSTKIRKNRRHKHVFWGILEGNFAENCTSIETESTTKDALTLCFIES